MDLNFSKRIDTHVRNTINWKHIVCPDMHGLETRQTSKLQSGRPLFDVELYLTVHKSFASTSLKYYSSWLHISSQLSLLDDYFIIRKYNKLNYRDCAQININSDKKHNTMTSV